MRIPGVPYVQGRNSYPDSDGTKFGVAIHNTSNTASAEAEASYATRRTDGVGAHFYVDADSVVQSLDTDVRAGHAGSAEGNHHAVAVEITGVNGWTRRQWLTGVAWDKLGQVLAVVCRRYGIAPRRATVAEMKTNPKVRAFYGHDDMRRAWGGTTHTDPGPNFPWDRLFEAVTTALDGEDADVSAADVWSYDPEDPDAPGAVRNRAWRPDAKTNRTVAPRWALETMWDGVQAIRDEQTRSRLRDEAILAAVAGLDTSRVLARIDEVAADEQQRDANLRDLVRQAAEGRLDATEVVRRIGELLSGGESPGVHPRPEG